jgi:ribonuclease HI
MQAYIDGASRGNPGRAGAGVVIYDETGATFLEESAYLGNATNNVAEYRALILALELAEKAGMEELNVFSDSELIVKQVNGHYRVKEPTLIKLNSKVLKQVGKLKRFTIRHIPRNENKIADRLANRAIDTASE